MKNRIILFKTTCAALCGFFILSAAGCQTLKKKFTRKPKAERESKFDPVLDPIDYAPTNITSEERFRHHYSLFRVWYRDLLTTINLKDSDKAQLYNLNKMAVELEEMQKWIDKGLTEKFNGIILELADVKKEYDKPASMRSTVALKSRLKKVNDMLKAGFDPKENEGFYK